MYASTGAAAAAAITRYFTFIPARYSISAVTPAQTSAVPRSGSLTISPMNSRLGNAAGISVLLQIVHHVQFVLQKPRQEEHDAPAWPSPRAAATSLPA